MAKTKRLVRKEYYPISDRIGIKLDIDNNTISLYDAENPTTNKNEIRLFQTKFFKSDWIKNLKDDLFFKMIKTALIDTSNSLKIWSAHSLFNVGSEIAPVYGGDTPIDWDSNHCTQNGCAIRYSEKLMEEYARLIMPFLTIDIRKQNDLLYKNSLDKINEEELNFYLKGIDDFEVMISVDSLYKNYIDLKDVKVFEDFQSSAMKTDEYGQTAQLVESGRFIAPEGVTTAGNPPVIGGVVTYLMNFKLYGNLTTFKGSIPQK